MKKPIILIGLILMFAVHAFGENVVLGPDGMPSQEDMRSLQKAVSKIVDRIYVEEGGIRDKSIIRVEYVANSSFSAPIELAAKGLADKDYSAVHTYVYVGVNTATDLLNKYPQIKLDVAKMAYLYAMDGEAYFNEGKSAPAIEAYKKSISYKKTAVAHFQLGFLYMLGKDTNNGKKYFDIALAMDKNLKPNYENAMVFIKQNGLVK